MGSKIKGLEKKEKESETKANVIDSITINLFQKV